MAKSKGNSAAGWYVIAQHDEFTVVQAAKTPDLSIEKGERLKTVFGPYGSEADARARADRLESRTLRSLAGNR